MDILHYKSLIKSFTFQNNDEVVRNIYGEIYLNPQFIVALTIVCHSFCSYSCLPVVHIAVKLHGHVSLRCSAPECLYCHVLPSLSGAMIVNIGGRSTPLGPYAGQDHD